MARHMTTVRIRYWWLNRIWRVRAHDRRLDSHWAPLRLFEGLR